MVIPSPVKWVSASGSAFKRRSILTHFPCPVAVFADPRTSSGLMVPSVPIQVVLFSLSDVSDSCLENTVHVESPHQISPRSLQPCLDLSAVFMVISFWKILCLSWVHRDPHLKKICLKSSNSCHTGHYVRGPKQDTAANSTVSAVLTASYSSTILFQSTWCVHCIAVQWVCADDDIGKDIQSPGNQISVNTGSIFKQAGSSRPSP